MKIGIGLPNAVPDTPGAGLLDWAVRAEERGFSALATIDRVAYPNHDSITALAGVAEVTHGRLHRRRPRLQDTWP